jgi:uncharacterized protein YraI
MPRRLFAIAFALGVLAADGGLAQSIAYAAPGTTNMRAGPGTEFPVIARILGGSAVHVSACRRDRPWCRSTVQGMEGWVSASRLRFADGPPWSDGEPRARSGTPVYQDPDRWQPVERDRVGGRVLGEVTDRPGYCYVLDRSGSSIVAPCP